MPQRPPKKIVLRSGPAGGRGSTDSAEAPSTGQPSAARPAPRAPAPVGRGSWLLPPILVAAVATAAMLVRGDLGGLFGLAFGLLVALGLTWILISVFFPPRADRSCPACGQETLERLDPRSTSGVRCSACGHRDEQRSAWLMAEEEGPLEPTVLRERGREVQSPEPRP